MHFIIIWFVYLAHYYMNTIPTTVSHAQNDPKYNAMTNQIAIIIML